MQGQGVAEFSKTRVNVLKICWMSGKQYRPCSDATVCGIQYMASALGKHAYSNILKILQSKKENFPIKNPIFFHISSLNIDCGYSLELPRRGGSNVYPQSMFFNKVRK